MRLLKTSVTFYLNGSLFIPHFVNFFTSFKRIIDWLALSKIFFILVIMKSKKTCKLNCNKKYLFKKDLKFFFNDCDTGKSNLFVIKPNYKGFFIILLKKGRSQMKSCAFLNYLYLNQISHLSFACTKTQKVFFIIQDIC
jgi:hypothetical protein